MRRGGAVVARRVPRGGTSPVTVAHQVGQRVGRPGLPHLGGDAAAGRAVVGADRLSGRERHRPGRALDAARRERALGGAPGVLSAAEVDKGAGADCLTRGCHVVPVGRVR